MASFSCDDVICLLWWRHSLSLLTASGPAVKFIQLGILPKIFNNSTHSGISQEKLHLYIRVGVREDKINAGFFAKCKIFLWNAELDIFEQSHEEIFIGDPVMKQFSKAEELEVVHDFKAEHKYELSLTTYKLRGGYRHEKIQHFDRIFFR